MNYSNIRVSHNHWYVRCSALLLAIVILVILAFPTRVARADASMNASCIGFEASAISPPGTNDEFPGGMPEVKAVISSSLPGIPYGAVISSFAKLHLGSHEACDEASE